MRLGVFGDVHANLAACKTVLDFLDSLVQDMRVRLGGSVGYNAEPTETLAMLRSRALRIVAGNHDRTVASAPVPGLMSANISRTHQWTRERQPDHFYGYITGATISEQLATRLEKGVKQ